VELGLGGNLGDGLAEETLAGDAGEDREVEGAEGFEAGEQGVILSAELAETEAGVEDDLVAGDSRGGGGGDALSQAA
jgi:hypothetical protein